MLFCDPTLSCLGHPYILQILCYLSSGWERFEAVFGLWFALHALTADAAIMPCFAGFPDSSRSLPCCSASSWSGDTNAFNDSVPNHSSRSCIRMHSGLVLHEDSIAYWLQLCQSSAWCFHKCPTSRPVAPGRASPAILVTSWTPLRSWTVCVLRLAESWPAGADHVLKSAVSQGPAHWRALLFQRSARDQPPQRFRYSRGRYWLDFARHSYQTYQSHLECLLENHTAAHEEARCISSHVYPSVAGLPTMNSDSQNAVISL